jgi:hypothetical protein
MNIYITNWGISEGLASTPLFHKRFLIDLPSSFINTFLVQLAVYHVNGGIGALLAVFGRINVDMAIDYHTNLANFTSDWLKETVYHEMSHASHYSKVGTSWYTQFVNAELAEIVAHPSGSLNPYGDGNSPSYSPIIALGEGWAYHMGHFLADQRYGVNGTRASEQTDANGFGIFFNPTGTNHTHIDVLENYDPNLATDPFRWIPKGLMEDMIDVNNEVFPVIDNINGFTVTQLFNGLQNDVTSLQQYKARLITQNPNTLANPNLSTQITNIFAQYHY